ncbi:glycine cleavage system protein GcvH [Promicromonospora sukumoe]|uniref:glycine cleavage system protein GcvH n=1 Tax=Promicromonospora sukumoe TaxID=88382 RepID=UPI000366957D|nr:glycine cleavage system protein GcvH [Promicromonospora sukumoe]
MAEVPSGLRYVQDHHWVAQVEPGTVRMGVTDFAQESLGDVVAVELPPVGTATTAGVAMGEIESTKSVSDLVAPVTGTVSAVNESVAEQPEIVNTDPYGSAWLVEIAIEQAAPTSPLQALLTASEYARLTGQ